MKPLVDKRRLKQQGGDNVQTYSWQVASGMTRLCCDIVGKQRLEYQGNAVIQLASSVWNDNVML